MKVIYNNFIPFKGFFAINLFGVLFIRSEYKSKGVSQRTLTHEKIHTAQMKEMGYTFFYIWYFIEWLLLLCSVGKDAYYWISFEREAYENDNNPYYLDNRKHYSWFKYYGKK